MISLAPEGLTCLEGRWVSKKWDEFEEDEKATVVCRCVPSDWMKLTKVARGIDIIRIKMI